MICATYSGDTPACVNLLASVWGTSYSQKYCRPASFSAFPQLLRTAL